MFDTYQRTAQNVFLSGIIISFNHCHTCHLPFNSLLQSCMEAVERDLHVSFMEFLLMSALLCALFVVLIVLSYNLSRARICMSAGGGKVLDGQSHCIIVVIIIEM